MVKEECFGIIPIRKNKERFEVFLVRHRKGMFWGFPKGHRFSEDESPKEIAQRELKEETNLDIERFIADTFEESYIFERDGNKIQKSVIYFLAEAKGTPKLQQKEIIEGGWFDLEESTKKITFPESKKISEEVRSLLNKSQF